MSYLEDWQKMERKREAAAWAAQEEGKAAPRPRRSIAPPPTPTAKPAPKTLQRHDVDLRMLSKPQRYEIYKTLAREILGQDIELLPRVRGNPFYPDNAFMLYGKAQWLPEKNCWLIGLHPDLILRGEVETFAHELAHVKRQDPAQRTFTPQEIDAYLSQAKTAAHQEKIQKVENDADALAAKILRQWRDAGLIW